MDPVRVVLAEDDPKQRAQLVEGLCSQSGLQIVGVARDGLEALRLVKLKRPQVLVCDMVMPHIDGFAVLEKIGRMDPLRQPKVIALTALSRDDFITRALHLGVSYYMVKPVNITFLTQQIMELAGRSETAALPAPPPPALPPQSDAETTEAMVAALLLQIGMPAHINGYKFTRQAVLMVLDQPELLSGITRMLYPAVASCFDTTPSRVERSIRHAIGLTWARGGENAFRRVMEEGAFTSGERPTNCELIALLSERIRFQTHHYAPWME